MAVQSRLARLGGERWESFNEMSMNYAIRGAMGYRNNHATIQRILQIGYVLFVLTSTYRGFSPKPKRKSNQKVEKAGSGASGAGEKEKKPKVVEEEEEASSGKRGGKRGKKGSRGPRVEVDAIFFQRLKRILRIVLPGAKSKETLLLLMHTFFLIARTMLSLYVADLDGRIVSALVRSQTSEFIKGIALWMAVAVPATYTNSMIEFLQNKIALSYRTRLTHKVHDQYLTDATYYKLGNLDVSVRICGGNEG